MTLQQICVSLELAKQLKAEGYPQESLFTWNVGIESCHPNLVVTNEKGFDRTNRFFHFYAAPTASEIGEKMPGIHFGHRPSYEEKWQASSPGQGFKGHFAISMADAAALNWLYLKKQGLLTTA